MACALKEYDVPVLDLGGGLGIDYQGDNLPDFAAYGTLVTRIFSNRGYRLGFELAGLLSRQIMACY